MAFTLPNFNLLSRWWNVAGFPAQPTLDDVPCQLIFPETGPWMMQNGPTAGWICLMLCRVPKGTPIAGWNANTQRWWAEIPKGTLRRYNVMFVDDAHRGFPNEFRVALLLQTNNWPNPFPLGDPGPEPKEDGT